MHVRPGFVMKVARSIEQTIVAHFAADATRFGLKLVLRRYIVPTIGFSQSEPWILK